MGSRLPLPIFGKNMPAALFGEFLKEMFLLLRLFLYKIFNNFFSQRGLGFV
jgi:hypothetical protein